MTTTADEIAGALEPVRRLTRDLKAAAKTMSPNEARYLVDAYYQMQRDRIRSGNQAKALAVNGEPNETVGWFEVNAELLERDIRRALDAYSLSTAPGVWARGIVGIGPVIAAGLLAHVDVAKCNTAGKVWRFAGLDPTVIWKKGEKRPWNAALKRLMWLLGESFTKVSTHDDDVYGKLYVQRKALEEQRNEAGLFKAQAEVSLATKTWSRDTKTRQAYEDGKLPQARIHLRAQRWAVKIFLSHYQHVAFFDRFHEHPPKPYVLAILGHSDEIQVPNWPF